MYTLIEFVWNNTFIEFYTYDGLTICIFFHWMHEQRTLSGKLTILKIL